VPVDILKRRRRQLDLRSAMIRLIAYLLLSALWAAGAFAAEQPGPSAALLANPIYSGIGLVYTCVANYYVSTTGSDSNPGTQAQPWATIQHADTLTRSPGDCINVAAGTYTWTQTFLPTKGGNNAAPNGYVTYRCQTLNECFIIYNGPANIPVWGISIPYL